MAISSMKSLVRQAHSQWSLVKLTIIHRVGHLELGETAVAVAVSSAHRANAFTAGQWLMDTLKIKVPIWKKENYSDGKAEWVHPSGPDEPVLSNDSTASEQPE